MNDQDRAEYQAYKAQVRMMELQESGEWDRMIEDMEAEQADRDWKERDD